MKLKKMHWIGIAAAVILLALDFIFFRNDERMLFFLGGIGISLGVLPFIVGLVIEGRTEQGVNEMFLEFARNLAESVGAGTPVSKSIVNMKNKNYGLLSPYIVKLSNQIELGIPVSSAFRTFADDIGSPVIERAVSLIGEAEKAGGEIDYILESTAKSIAEVEKLKKERKAAIYNLVVQGYIIFFIFLGIIMVMEYKIIPMTTSVSGFSTETFDVNKVGEGISAEGGLTTEHFTKPFLYLLLVQGLFAGLTIGKLTEGSIKKGIKHSFVLMIVAFLVSTGAKLFLTPAVV